MGSNPNVGLFSLIFSPFFLSPPFLFSPLLSFFLSSPFHFPFQLRLLRHFNAQAFFSSKHAQMGFLCKNAPLICYCQYNSWFQSTPLKLPQRNIYIMMYISIINYNYIMTEERLSGLELLYIHRDTHFIPSPEDIYSKKANWRHVREN